jgi:ligand-binding sensor domain-containing protein
VGTTGGLLVLDPLSGATTQFLPEHGLPANNVTAVQMAPDTAVWAATANGGVGRYNGQLWERFTVSHGLPSNRVRDLAITAEGHVWAATSHGLAHFDPATPDIWTSYTTANTLLDLPTDDLTSLTAVSGGLWLGSQDGLIFYDTKETWQQITTAEGLPHNHIQDTAVGNDGLLWVATPAGLGRYDGHSWRTISEKEGLLSNNIVSLDVAPNGQVWLGFGDMARGAQRLQEQDGRVSLALYQTQDGLPDDTVTAVGISPAGDVWLGTTQGLAHQPENGDTAVWHTIPIGANLPSNHIHDMQSVGNTLWVATEQGVSQFDGTAWTHFGLADGLAQASVQALSVDPTGKLWAVHRTPVQGFSQYDAVQEAWRPRPCVRSESSPNIYASASQTLLITAETGAGWLGTHDGLYRLEPTADGLRCLYQAGLAQESVYTAVSEPTAPDRALLATSRGLWQANPAELHSWPTWPPAGEATHLTRITSGPDSSLWVMGNGFVARTAGARTEWEVIPLTDVFSGEIRDIALGRDLTLYVATNKGILRYNGQWQTFTTATGLASNDVRHLEAMADGSIWMATSAGLSHFQPQPLSTSQK